MPRPRRTRREAAPGRRRVPGEPTVVSVRAHVEPEGWTARPPAKIRTWPRAALVIHTVPQACEGEPLWFGVWHLVHLDGPWLSGPTRGVFYADGLEASDLAELDAACRGRRLPAPVTRRRFVESTLYKNAYKAELPLVGWFLPEDLGRLASTGPMHSGVTRARSRSSSGRSPSRSDVGRGRRVADPCSQTARSKTGSGPGSSSTCSTASGR